MRKVKPTWELCWRKLTRNSVLQPVAEEEPFGVQLVIGRRKQKSHFTMSQPQMSQDSALSLSRKGIFWAGEMALATKPNNLSSIPGTLKQNEKANS